MNYPLQTWKHEKFLINPADFYKVFKQELPRKKSLRHNKVWFIDIMIGPQSLELTVFVFADNFTANIVTYHGLLSFF